MAKGCEVTSRIYYGESGDADCAGGSEECVERRNAIVGSVRELKQEGTTHNKEGETAGKQQTGVEGFEIEQLKEMGELSNED